MKPKVPYWVGVLIELALRRTLKVYTWAGNGSRRKYVARAMMKAVVAVAARQAENSLNIRNHMTLRKGAKAGILPNGWIW